MICRPGKNLKGGSICLRISLLIRSFGSTDRSLCRSTFLKILGIENGHRSNVTFIVENGEVKIVNSAAYAMNNLKKAKDKEAA